MIKDYYKILDSKYNEDFNHLRIKFIKKVMPLHPDNTTNKTEGFKVLNEAFFVLSNIDYKEEYIRFYKQQVMGEDLGISEKYIQSNIKKWDRLSAKKSKKYSKISARDFLESIPKTEVESDISFIHILYYILDIFRITFH